MQKTSVRIFIPSSSIKNYKIKPYICGAFNKFPDFFVQAFKIDIDFFHVATFIDGKHMKR